MNAQNHAVVTSYTGIAICDIECAPYRVSSHGKYPEDVGSVVSSVMLPSKGA